MKKPRHPVSDSALVQYLQLTTDLDIAAIRAEIGARVEIGLQHGAGAVRSHGLVYSLRAGCVTRVRPMSLPPLRIGSYRRRKELPDDTA